EWAAAVARLRFEIVISILVQGRVRTYGKSLLIQSNISVYRWRHTQLHFVYHDSKHINDGTQAFLGLSHDLQNAPLFILFVFMNPLPFVLFFFTDTCRCFFVVIPLILKDIQERVNGFLGIWV